MDASTSYLAILRCQTWHVWPNMARVKCHGFALDFGSTEKLPLKLRLQSYVQRTEANVYSNEDTGIGPQLWDGRVSGPHHWISNTVVKAPEDVTPIELRYRHVERGEIDICLAFSFDGLISPSLTEALRATAYSIMSLLNLQLGDKMVAKAPFQIIIESEVGKQQMAHELAITVFDRLHLDIGSISTKLSKTATVLMRSKYGKKLRVALELYAAHFTEQQVRVRFLLLMTALESLALPTEKHPVAFGLLTRWKAEVCALKSRFDPKTEEHMSLEAVYKDVNFRTNDSVGTQIRKLFVGLPGVDSIRASELRQKVKRVYDQRSILVHSGYLPEQELFTLEADARTLLELLFKVAAGDQSDDASPVSVQH